MNDSLTLEVDISSPHAEAIEAALREFLSEQFGSTAEPLRSVRRPTEDVSRGPEWMEWATFALSVPGGLIAALDLAERLKLTQGLQRLLQRLRTAGREHDGGVVLKVGNRPAIDLTSASAGEVVEALEEEAAKLRK